MVGATFALAAGLHRRYGWRVALMAGAAAALPDWDGLTLLLGPVAYAQGHRVWGHNVLVAGLLGGVWGGAAYLLNRTARVRRWADSLRKQLVPQAPPSAAPPP